MTLAKPSHQTQKADQLELHNRSSSWSAYFSLRPAPPCDNCRSFVFRLAQSLRISHGQSQAFVSSRNRRSSDAINKPRKWTPDKVTEPLSKSKAKDRKMIPNLHHRNHRLDIERAFLALFQIDSCHEPPTSFDEWIRFQCFVI